MTGSLLPANLLLAQVAPGAPPPEATSNAALITFLLYTVAVFGIAALSNQLLKNKSFLSEYFLGSRGLGVWAFALTFAATSSSGGSFTGFPSKIYSHGWILALWIGSYMVVPICTMGLLGKRINNVARIAGSITVPDVIRDRFRSPAFGLLAVMLIVFFMSFNLVAQFKAGSLILRVLVEDISQFKSAAVWLGGMTTSTTVFGLNVVDPQYLLCLVTFGVAVIIYTTYGGFHAVVWTDVMQGVVMVIGVMIMLPLALSQVGGMDAATKDMAKMTPPRRATASLVLEEPRASDSSLASDTWIRVNSDNPETELPRLFRLTKTVLVSAGETEIDSVPVLEITSPHEIERMIDGERRVPLASGVVLTNIDQAPYAYGAATEDGKAPLGVYVTGPGPSPTSDSGFLPLSLAISFFFMWAISGTGQPSNMVRLMAFNSSTTLRRSIFTVAIYYTAIYFPLVLIFCCARVLMPGMEAEPDRIMPAMAVYLTQGIGAVWLAGFLVAAPFAAVMSTVDSFLLMISSAVVRDIYQRNINPEAQEATIKRLSYLVTLLVGTAAMIGAVNPPRFLQDIIVYTGSGLAAAFLAPMVFLLYWPRANAIGCMGAMLSGFAAHLSMYVAGMFLPNGSFFDPWRPMDFDPILIGLFTSFVGGWIITLITPPPPADLVARYFHEGGDKTVA